MVVKIFMTWFITQVIAIALRRIRLSLKIWLNQIMDDGFCYALE
jgi:hypothetical protein